MNKRIKIKIVEIITCWSASFGAVGVIMGGAGCLGGLTATGVIKASELLLPHRPAIQKSLFYGAVTSGAGIFLVGFASGLAAIGEKMCDEEMARINKQIAEAKESSKYSQCFKCKYYTSHEMLPCAVHQGLKEDCNDCEESSRN